VVFALGRKINKQKVCGKI